MSVCPSRLLVRLAADLRKRLSQVVWGTCRRVVAGWEAGDMADSADD